VKSDKLAKILWLLFSLAVLVIVAGYWFTTDTDTTVFGKYSNKTILIISLITLGGYFNILIFRFILSRQYFGSGSKRRIIPFHTKLLPTIALILFGFLGAEGILQWKFHTNLKEHREKKIAGFDPFLQAVPKPNNKKLRINRWGFRGEEIERIKTSGTYRIFVVGGSTVYCSDVDFEQSHTRIMEKQLRQFYPKLKIEVQNAGMDWHTSQHSLMKILFNIQDFNPDMIIIYHAINDLHRSFCPENFALGPYQNDYSHYLGPVAPIVREYFREQTGHRILTLDRTFAFFRRHWFADFRNVSKPESTSDLPEESVNSWPSLRAFERNMKNIATLLKSLDIELVMASQPYLYRHDLNEMEIDKIWFPAKFGRIGRSKADISSMISGMEAFNDASRRIADSNGVLFIDLDGEVPKSLDYFLDDVHYTEKGNRIVGRHLTEQIIAGGYIDKKFPESVAAVSHTSYLWTDSALLQPIMAARPGFI